MPVSPMQPRVRRLVFWLHKGLRLAGGRRMKPWPLLDRIAARLAIWALQRIYGDPCETDVRGDFPDEPNIQCIGCDATRIVAHLREIAGE